MGIGRALIFLGVVLVVVGLLFILGDKLPIRLGRLPVISKFAGRIRFFISR